VGSISALTPDDYIYTSYREHGHAIARGIPPGVVMAELFGKEDGAAHGRGGSMHMFAPGLHFMGGWAIVGGHLPIAAGAAFAINYQGGPGVSVCYLGEGATNIGAFHETLNVAKLWKLPVLFIVVNNLYEMGTPVEKASSVPEQYKKAAAYGIPSERVDGMDVLAVHDATQRAMDHIRREREPVFLEFMAYRFRGHSVIDPGRYRTEEEVKAWMLRDPILMLRGRMAEAKLLDDAAIAAVEQRVEAEVQAAVDFADASPFPDVSTLFDYMYA
ncbi:MAG: thiamine pyrophosphate-dependent enzyme, partial [Chloroflexota bacterium]